MFVSKVEIKNFRLFEDLVIDNLNIPDKVNEGTGLTIIVGENGCGKTTILDSIAYTTLEYKADSFNISDLNDTDKKVDIKTYPNNPFDVLTVMPRGTFKCKGFNFKGGLRIRNIADYLSSTTVSEQLFMDVDDSNNNATNINLRMRINNPYKGKRFNNTDIVYLDKNRLAQTKTGTFNDTRFDRIMDDLNYQYNKNNKNKIDINESLDLIVKSGNVDNTNLKNALNKFEEISKIKLHLDFLDNYKPFENANFVVKKDKLQHILLSNIGSGYEMIFSLIYSYYMSEQTNKDMIILIDEPELHLHPSIQQKFVNFLIKISKNHQIILTTHSPLLVKQLYYNDKIKALIIKDDKTIVPVSEIKLSYISSNEINYIAFGLATEEYHNELYEELKDKYGSNLGIKQFDNDYFVNAKGEVKQSPWKGNQNEVSIHTFIRNQIHHRSENGVAKYIDLKNSIEKMRSFL